MTDGGDILTFFVFNQIAIDRKMPDNENPVSASLSDSRKGNGAFAACRRIYRNWRVPIFLPKTGCHAERRSRKE